MRISRFFIDCTLQVGEQVALPKETAHYMLNVLRLKVGQVLTVFNGRGGEFSAHLLVADRKQTILVIDDYHDIARESSLNLTLIQAISKPDHMDFTIQKAVELGVTRIVPVFSEYSVSIDRNRLAKRQQHWQKIMVSACEQSGRNCLPELLAAQTLEAWLQQPLNGWNILLNPEGQHRLREVGNTDKTVINVLVGAEGGLSAREIEAAQQAGYLSLYLGTRVLRTETAAIAILSICQARWGDL